MAGLCVFLVALISGSLSAETGGYRPYNPFVEEEAEPALIQLERTDADVDLYVLGDWAAGSRISTGIAFHPARQTGGNRFTFPYEYPGFETELFSQTLDIVLSLWFYERYFFEAGFSDDSPTNTIALGYVAREDELVQELVVGNVPLAIEPYPYQYTGSPGARAGLSPQPGGVLRLQTARTRHELLLQLENSRLETRRFSGGGVLEEVRIRPESYLREGVYVLPHAPVRDLEVYVRDPDGSVEIASDEDDAGLRPRIFRRLETSAGDYTVDSSTGVIRLGPEIPRDVTIAAAYDPVDPLGRVTGLDGDGTPTDTFVDFPLSDDDGDGTDFNDAYGVAGTIDRYRLEVTAGAGAGKRGVFLEQPGRYSPFAAANHYELPSDARTAVEDGSARIRLVRRGSRVPVEDEASFLLAPIARGTLLQVTRHDSGDPAGAAPLPAKRDWKYPFAGRSPVASHAAIYGPGSHGTGASAPVEILLEYRAAEAGFYLDGDIVPGTVSVTRDGRPLPGVEIDYRTGEVTLPENIPDDADLDARYRVYSPEDGVGDVVAITGNRWRVNENLLLSLAAGLRWTVTADQYSRELEENPGQLTTSAGVRYVDEKLSVDAAAAVQLYQPDTTGFMRLFGGDEETFSISPRATTLFPASPPDEETLPNTLPGQPSDDAYRADERAYALYRDYWTSDLLGSAGLQTYTRTVSADEDREGARMGPYLARSTDSGYTGTVGVLEWESLAPGEWTGASIRVSSPPADLRDARRVTVTYRYIPDDPGDDGSATELLFQLGSLEEDLDGDGRAASGRSAVDPTFEFVFPPDHPREGQVRRVGQDAPGLAAPHREDPRRDGILRREIPESVLTVNLGTAGTNGPETTVDTSGEWRVHTVTLTREEAEKFRDLRAARVLVRNPDDTETAPSGRLLIGPIEIDRTGNAVVIDGQSRDATVSVGSDPASPRLRDAYDVVKDRFNPDESDQPVLELTWGNGTTTPDRVAAAFSIPDFSTDRYGTLEFYTFLAPPADNGGNGAPPADTVTLTLAPWRDAPESRSLSVQIPAETLYDDNGTGPWRRVRVNLESGTVSVDSAGGSGNGGSAEIPPASLPRDRATVLREGVLSVDGVSEAGRLYFDELHARDPQAGVAAAARIGVVWQSELGAGNLTLEQDLEARSAGFRSTETAGGAGAAAGTVAGRSGATYRLGRFRASGETSYRIDQERAATGTLGHGLTVPVGPARPIGLVVEEAFFHDFDSRSPLADRRLAFVLGNTKIGRYRYTHRHRTDQRETQLRWSTLLSPPLPGPLDISLDSTAELRDLDRVIRSTDYGESWIETGRFVFSQGPPGDDTRQERRLDGRIGIDYLRWRNTLSGGWRNRSDTAGTQENLIALETRLPLEFSTEGRRPWSITPGYRRSWRATDREESDTFADDFTLWREAVAGEPAVFTAVPLVELFQSPGDLGLDVLEAPRNTRDYEAEASVRFSRAFSSRPRDLFTPAETEALLRRNTAWSADTRTDRRTWQLTLTAVAINLFGEQGSTPLARWYRSDEFRNRLLLSVTETVPGEITRWRVELKNDTVLLGFSENELSLTGGVDITGGDSSGVDYTGELRYRWQRPGYPPLGAFQRMDTPPFYRHTERAEITASWEDGDFAGSEIQIGHETALVIGMNGEIRLYTDVGWIADPAEYEDGALHLLGIQAGIEGILRY